MELLHGIGLAAPETVELCWELNQEGFDLPLDKLDPKKNARRHFYDMVMADPPGGYFLENPFWK